MKRRLFSLLLTGAMLFSMYPSAAAAGPDGMTGGLCSHHQEHSYEVCGYVEAVEEIPCNMDCAETGEDGQIIHIEGCAYTSAVTGQPCGYVCRICPVQAMIDALPDAEGITPDNRAEVEAQLAAIDTARVGLTDEEIEQLNTTRYQAVVSALSALDGQEDSDLPALLAEGTISYLSCDSNGQNWETKTVTATEVTANDTTWGRDDGQEHWYVASGTMAINRRVTVTGNVHLILADGCDLTISGYNCGIQVQDDDGDISNGSKNALTIYGQQNGNGKLTVVSASYSNVAGIGGGSSGAGGTITINGGTVSATVSSNIISEDGAGIGGGSSGAGGTITINGGTVSATAGDGAAIGGGEEGDGGIITINGGTVSATAGDGAAIGGGEEGDGGTVTINGGTVSATGSQGRGIGGGRLGAGGDITISGGIVHAYDIGGPRASNVGTFSTGTNGTAVIFASSIKDQSGKASGSWSGVIFERREGRIDRPYDGLVYGSPTIQTDIELPNDDPLTIPADTTITFGKGVTLTNGTIINNGTISGAVINNSMINNNGTINAALTNSKTIYNAGTMAGNVTNNGMIYNIGSGTVSGPVTGNPVINTPNAKYLDTDGQEQDIPSGATYLWGATYADAVTWNNGWYVIGGAVEFSSRIKVTGDVHLVLLDGCSLTARKGISVNKGQALTIYAQSKEESTAGKLSAFGTYISQSGGVAGIGGDYRTDCGTITINSGVITATSNNTGAAIGGGGCNSDGSAGDNGTIIINGGIVRAVHSDRDRSAIGGGSHASFGSGGAGGQIIIKGGTVIADGIGGGDGYHDSFGTYPDLTISGGSCVIVRKSLFGKDGGSLSITEDSVFVCKNIPDPYSTDGWDGLVINGDKSGIYGSTEFTLTKDIEVLKNTTLTIANGKTLTIDSGVTLTNNGTINIDQGGTLMNKGTITGSGTINGTVSGNKATPAPDTPNNLTATYGQTLADVSLPTGWTWDHPSTSVGNVGINSFPATYTPDSSNNYSTVKDSIAVRVGKAIPAVTAPTTSSDLTYNGSTQPLVSAGSTSGGTLLYSTDDINYSSKIPKGTDAKAYTVYYKVVGNDSYNGVDPQSVPVTINQKSIAGATVTVSGNPTYTGQEIKPAVTVTVDGTQLREATDYTVSYTDNTAVGDATATVTGKGNYTGTASTNFSIGKATPTVQVTVEMGGNAGARRAELTVTVTGVTNGAAPTGKVTLTGDNGLNQTLTLESNGKATYTWSDLADGQYKITAAYSGDDNYDTVSEEKSFDTSKQEQATLTIGSVGNKTYGDPAFTLSASGGSGTGAVTFTSSDPSVISISGTTATIHKAGGPVTITATKAEDENYNAASDTLNVTVAKKAVVFKANDKTVQQGGTMPTFDYAPVTLAQGDSITTQPTAACTATDTNTTGTFPITLSGAVLTSGDSYEISYQPGTLTVTAQSTYTVTVSGGTGGGSYAAGDTVTITAAVPSGQRFTGWAVNEGGVTLADASSATTTFTMPAQAVTVTANFQSNSGGGGGGRYTPPTTTYPPTVERPSGGGGEAPAVSPSNPKQGDSVTVTPKPDDGYEVDKITVTDRNGRPVEVTKKPDGTYTFKQPNGRVTIEIEYTPVPLTELPWNNPFTDVSEGDWYYEAVRFVHERGLMNGYSDGRFGPNDNLSRAQLAQILFNKEGKPVVNYLMNFSDVADEAWYTEAIRWATSQGIVGGYGNGRFGPNDPITREQLAVMLWRYSGSPAATNKELHFNDTDEISGFALEAMRWAVENGILNGYGDGRLGPQGQATRAQVAQMLKNFIENQEETT